MNIACVICSDLLTPTDDIFHTPCGHIFHFTCLTQWLERSKTCPQCREKTTSPKIHRLYFNFCNNDSITEDKYSLQNKVDKLSLELALKEKDAKHYSEKSEALEKETKCLKKELVKINTEKNSVIAALKQQVNYFRDQASETNSMKKENEQMRVRLETIQMLLEASVGDIDDMISRTADPNTLVTYISVMKREMTISLNKRRELRAKLRSMQQELSKTTIEKKFLQEEHARRKKIEEDFMICESEKMLLQNKLRELEKATCSLKRTCNLENNANSNTDNVCNENAVKNTTRNECITVEDTDHTEKNVAANSVKGKKENDSPYLPIKSGGLYTLKQVPDKKRGTKRTHSSIFTIKPRAEQTSVRPITFDGYGGHSKFDEFPSSSGTRAKKEKNKD
ncbi:TRAF interacting protein no poles isoform X2 [Megalopta genalis]|uniref:TRAF interacting protein no poles isoform X2 n=1 Tax=Megalopta genalis TaxID=115081 RepID=UPI003FD2DC12